MRRIFRTVSIVLLCGLLCAPVLEARGRTGNGNGNGGAQRPQTQQSAPQRPGNNGASHSSNSGSQRPGNNGNSGSQRPNNNSGNSGWQRPGNGGGNSFTNNSPQRPGNNGGGNFGNNGGPQRPGNGGSGGVNNPGGNHGGNSGYNPGGNPGGNHGNPGNNFGPGHGNPGHANPGHGFGPGYNNGNHYGHVHFGYPSRPMMPAPRPYSRPVPPARYTPFHGPSISTILGVALGTTLSYALNSLIYNGYDVTGYGNDAIYLNNVRQLNMMWPSATMYYTNGMLSASEFVYSTPYYDMYRYNSAYSLLVNTYGVPVSTQPYGNGGLITSWWGNGGQYITLQYAPMTAANGTLRYYTTLSFGN